MPEPKSLLAPQRAAYCEPRLWHDGRFVVDRWLTIADDAAVPSSGQVIVSLPRWRQQQRQLVDHGPIFGIRVDPSDAIDPATDDIGQLKVIALVFPKFTDGRAYSTARRLSEQWHFKNELRATGDVLLDQLPLMLRCGFTTFEIIDGPTMRALETAPLPAVRHIYQGRSSDGSGWRSRSSLPRD